MDKKIIALLIILIFSVGCLSFVSADNNTTDTATVENSEKNVTVTEEDLTDYITPVHITDKGIEFSDGFVGFCIDSAKGAITANDKFTSQNTGNDEIQNNVKLAIIDCYKSGKENNIQNVVSQAISGNKNYNSGESVGDTAVVKINNTTEATFTFELLKPADSSHSDCLAYKVSLKTVAGDDVLGASDNNVNDTVENTTENNATTENTTINNATSDNTTENKNASDEKQLPSNQTVINNNTIINNTNNTVNIENNTTIINQNNNTKIINKTNELPKNATLQQRIMRTVGNPIFLLVLVIVIIAVVAVVIRRKG